jgi:hypothetical protein
MILLKAVRLQYIVTFLITINFLNLQKQFGLLNTELEILKSLLRTIYKQTDYLCFYRR